MSYRSMLDTDLYKFSMSYAYQQKFPRAKGTFTFIDRELTVHEGDGFFESLKLELSKMYFTQLTHPELEYMAKTCPYIPLHYWEWLANFKFNREAISITLDEGKLQIKVTDYLYKATLWETHVLDTVSEVYYKFYKKTINLEETVNKLDPKIKLSNIEKIKFSEFGTRRRFSYTLQDKIVERIARDAEYCTGTSNCHFAMKYGLKPIGTVAHEWFMFHGAIFGYKQANYMALENWSDVYDGDLGIALSDTYTSDVFFDNFSKKHAKLFDGVRQDSGDEFKFINKAVKRYKEHGIDPTLKTIIFSNSLDFEKADEIKDCCAGRIQCAFGIGTNLTNDTIHKPLNIVMKLTSCSISEGKDVIDCIKLSDDTGKYTGTDEEYEICKKTLKL